MLNVKVLEETITHPFPFAQNVHIWTYSLRKRGVWKWLSLFLVPNTFDVLTGPICKRGEGGQGTTPNGISSAVFSLWPQRKETVKSLIPSPPPRPPFLLSPLLPPPSYLSTPFGSFALPPPFHSFTRHPTPFPGKSTSPPLSPPHPHRILHPPPSRFSPLFLSIQTLPEDAKLLRLG